MPTHDVDARRIAWVGATLAGVVVLVVAAVFLLLRDWQIQPGADRVALQPLPHEGASLQSAPQADLARYRAEKQRLLETSGWVDAHRGIARIPIGTAMALLAPAQPAASQPEAPR